MQDPEHIKAKCPKCHAGRFEPCVTLDGRIAEKVHYGRPYWSSRLGLGRQNKPKPPSVSERDLPPWHWDNCESCGAKMLAPDDLLAICVVCRVAA